MLVSSPSCSNSRSFRLLLACGEDRTLEDATEDAGDARPLRAGVAERPRIVLSGGRIEGGRIEVFALLIGGAPGRGSPDISKKISSYLGVKSW
jgi:hypothetical protein